MSRETDLAWAAGFFDGEGSMGIYATRRQGWYCPEMSAVQNSREPLEKILDLLGCGYIRSRKIGARFEWRCGARTPLLRALSMLLPYLVVKRKQAIAMLNWGHFRRFSTRGSIFSDGEKKIDAWYSRTLKSLKKDPEFC